jgi:simple sugar transport system permease protein
LLREKGLPGTVESVAAAGRDERLIRIGLVSRLVQRPDIGAFLGAVAVFFLFSYTARQVNWISDLGVTSNWLNTAAYDGIVAVPVALLMIGGEFDLSAGVMIGSSGILLGLLTTRADMNIWPAIALVLLFGLAVGFVNGFTVIKTRLPSFIVTLGTFFVLRGLNAGGTLHLTGTVAIQNIDQAPGFGSARKLFASTVWPHYGLSVAVVWWVAITVLAAWMLARTRFGNWIYSVGGDPVAARNVGVPVARTKILLFMLTSGIAALWGIMTAISLRSIQANEGVGREFEFIIAAVVGGCLLTGGYGSVIGAAFGAAILGMAGQGIIFSGWDTNWVFLFEGVILVMAVMLNALIRSRARRGR